MNSFNRNVFLLVYSKIFSVPPTVKTLRVKVRVLTLHFHYYLALTRGLFSTRIRDRIDLEVCSSAHDSGRQSKQELFKKRWCTMSRDGCAEEMDLQ